MIIRCSCQHKYQDEKYGPGNRVHNMMKDTKGQIKWRCTVCKDEKPNPKETQR